MLRIRKTTIKILIEQKFDEGELISTIDDIKFEIAEGLDTLKSVADKFEEVRIDKDGNLHCKNIAPVAESVDDS